MFLRHKKTFAFESHEIGCVNPNVVVPMQNIIKYIKT